MAISRYNYIHRNKSNITVGIKGQAKSVFEIKDIVANVSKVQQQSIKLSMEYSKNAKFPDFLGMDKEYTKILREIPYKLSDVIEKKGHYEPQQIFESLKYLKSIATDEESFKREFYNEVNKYYGTNFDTKQTEILLKKGTFMYVPHDYSHKPSDPVPLQDWIIKNTELDESQIRRINDLEELKKIAQTYIQARELA